jgi:hypothetical protein
MPVQRSIVFPFPVCRPFLVAFARTSLAQEIVAGENKMFARAEAREFAHRQPLHRSTPGWLRAGR